jgi:hypothetical protein
MSRLSKGALDAATLKDKDYVILDDELSRQLAP